jgi:ABC-2 type transport system permease protein
VAAHLFRLRVDSLLGAVRARRSHRARIVVGLVVLAAALVAAGVAILRLRDAEGVSAAVVVIFAGSALTLGFALAPLVVGAVDPLDPRRFAVLAPSAGPLAAMLAVVGLVSVPTLVVAVLAGSVAAMWIGRGESPFFAVLSAVVGVVTCSLFARVSEALAALVIRERRSRELTGLFVVGAIVVIVPVAVFLASLDWRGVVPVQVRQAVDVLALTPFGAAWALPVSGDAARWMSLLVAVATVVLLGAAWFAIVRRVLSWTERPLAVRERGGLGWFAVAPGSAGGAIAARSLVYWSRDRRYLVNVVIVPVAAVLILVPLIVVGVPTEIVALVPVPVMALFFGWLVHNDLAYDSTAVWMHVAGGVRGAADRVGRLVPMLLVGIPVLAIAVPIAIAVQGRWSLLPALAGVCIALFFSGLGLSSIASVAAPYPVAGPGDSPFQQPQRTGAAPAVSQALVMVGAIVLSAPALWWGWLALTVDTSYALAALVAGVVGGIVVLVGGIAIGAAVFSRSGGRIMEFAESA